MVMILFMANFLVEQEESITKSLKGFFGALFIVGLSGALTMAETDLINPTIGAVNFSSTNTGNKHEKKQEKCQSKNE
jgi:cell division protein FtsW (lipid II flippase)